MCRPSREFRAASFELEGRLLLSIGPASIPVRSQGVHFESTTSPGATPPTQVVTQQDGEATVTLSRSNTAGGLQVQVSTEPYPSAVGVNVAAVDQTVTFANGQGQATVTVPILSGAPNPGEVDVILTVRPIDQRSPIVINAQDRLDWMPLDLKILASADATLPPKIVSEQVSHQGIVLTFSKPMNPVEASKVNNYAVTLANVNLGGTRGGTLGLVLGWHSGGSSSSKLVGLQSARYNPSNNTVTLIPKQRNLNLVSYTSITQMHPAKTSVRPGLPLNVGPGLTDLQGSPINADTTPGKVDLRLSSVSGGYGW